MYKQKTTEQKVIKFILAKKLIQEKDKILVALSGGPDSVFLLDVLNKYKRRFDIELGTFHLNHNLRGKDSDEDEDFCKKLALSYDIPFFRSSKNVSLFAKKNRLSLEEAGRDVRYKELMKVAKQNKFTKIATGHTLDDNAETMLLNFIKGSGLNGLSGIREKRDIIIRPILSLSKDEILDYLHGKKMNYRIDNSNLQNDYQRNYLRNEIIPLIRKKLNPQFDAAASRTAENMKNISSFVNDEVKKNLEDCSIFRNDSLIINCKKIKNLNEYLLGSFFQFAANKYFNIELEQKNIADLQKLLYKQTGRRLNLVNEIVAVKERNAIIIFNRKLNNIVEKDTLIKIGDKKKIGNNVISISQVSKTEIDYNNSQKKEYIDAEKIKGSLLLRRWKSGERFHPLGMKDTKKVSDFLNEQKVQSNNKKMQLVLTESGNIVWIIGIRIDNRYRLTEKTSKVLELCLS